MIETISVFGRDILLYRLFFFVGAFAALIAVCAFRKEYGYSFSRCIIFTVLNFAFLYLWMWGTSWMFGGGKTIGANFVRAVIFIPLYLWLIAYMFKEPFWKVADFISPIVAINFGVGHLGCIFPGCCHGYPSSWGLYSNAAGTVCFPITLIEVATSVLIGVVLIIMGKRGIQKGCLYPWFMVLFGPTRFIFEYFRDNEKIWNGISELAFHALAATVLGLIALLVCNSKFKGSFGDE